MITYNGLTIEVYTGSSTVIPTGLLSTASGLQFTSAFPGGLYVDCSFYVPRELASYWNVRGAQRVVIRSGQRVVWEGKIDSLNNQANGGEQGTLVQCTGYWGALMMRYAIRKRWADTRITEDVWQYVKTASGSSKCTLDRQNRIRFTPKAEAWTTDQAAVVRYTMPIGRTVKRIKYSYAFAEAAQAWEIHVRRSTDGLSFTQMTDISGETYASGTTTVIADDGAGIATGNIDVTLATPSRYIDLRFYSKADQTPTADGAIYGEFSAITVYDETGVIDAEEVGYDLIGACSELSTSTVGISDGLSGETLPAIDILVYDQFTSLADIAMDVAGYGNTSDESLYFQCRASEEASTNDGSPLLAAGVYPDLTTANYVVRLSDDNVVSADITRSYGDIQNWIAVNYTDERNEQQIITPDDVGYGLLTDATSTSAYGRRVSTIQSGTLQTKQYWETLERTPMRGGGYRVRPSSAALAYYYGKRYLAKWKNPLWSGSITVIGYILGSGGNEIPASEIEAGKVLDLADYVVDEVLASDTLDYPRVIITATSYDAESETCVITFGPLDDLKMIQIETMNFIPQETPSTGGSEGGGGKDRLNWKRQYGLKPGTAMWDEAMKLGKKAFLAKYPNLKRKRKN